MNEPSQQQNSAKQQPEFTLPELPRDFAWHVKTGSSSLERIAMQEGARQKVDVELILQALKEKHPEYAKSDEIKLIRPEPGLIEQAQQFFSMAREFTGHLVSVAKPVVEHMFDPENKVNKFGDAYFRPLLNPKHVAGILVGSMALSGVLAVTSPNALRAKMGMKTDPTDTRPFFNVTPSAPNLDTYQATNQSAVFPDPNK